jgi:hypothetical protein
MPPQAADWRLRTPRTPANLLEYLQSSPSLSSNSGYCRCKRINKREHISYSARENNITCKAILWMAKVQAL